MCTEVFQFLWGSHSWTLTITATLTQHVQSDHLRHAVGIRVYVGNNAFWFICFHTYHWSNCRDIYMFSHISGGPVMILFPAYHLPCQIVGLVAMAKSAVHIRDFARSFIFLSWYESVSVDHAGFSASFRASQKECDNLLNVISWFLQKLLAVRVWNDIIRTCQRI